MDVHRPFAPSDRAPTFPRPRVSRRRRRTPRPRRPQLALARKDRQRRAAPARLPAAGEALCPLEPSRAKMLGFRGCEPSRSPSAPFRSPARPSPHGPDLLYPLNLTRATQPPRVMAAVPQVTQRRVLNLLSHLRDRLTNADVERFNTKAPHEGGPSVPQGRPPQDSHLPSVRRPWHLPPVKLGSATNRRIP
jgi:hypothetical protein